MANGMGGFQRWATGPESGRRGGPRSAEDWNRRETCGNPACTRGWLSFLKDWRRPVFEGRWGCTTQCMEAMVGAAVRRESGDGDAEDRVGEHRHRMPLGLILLAHGWITHPELQHALDRQRRAGRGRIGRWLIEECGLDHGCVTRGLGVQWGCPVLPMEGFDPEQMVLAAPRLLVEQVGMLPLRIAGERTLQLAFADRLDEEAAFAMERMSGLKVESGLVDEAQCNSARHRLCGCKFVEAGFEQVAAIETLAGRVAAALREMRPIASRMVRVRHFFWLRMWLESGAMRSRVGGIPASREDVADRLYVVGTEQ